MDDDNDMDDNLPDADCCGVDIGERSEMKNRIRYRCRKYKYQLVEPYEIMLPELIGDSFETPYFSFDTYSILTINALYAWDGPSGPTIDTPSFMRGSLVHDVLYQAIRLGLLPVECKEIADNILYRLCREDGMSWLRAQWVLRAVRKFGGSSCEPGTDDDDIKEAP